VRLPHDRAGLREFATRPGDTAGRRVSGGGSSRRGRTSRRRVRGRGRAAGCGYSPPGAPRRMHAPAELRGAERQVRQKVGVRAAGAVRRRALGGAEVAADPRQVEPAQQRRVIQHEPPLPLLGAAGHLPPADRQVAGAGRLGAGRGGERAHDERGRAVDAVEPGAVEPQHQRHAQAPGPEDDRAAAARPPHDRHPVGGARGRIHVDPDRPPAPRTTAYSGHSHVPQHLAAGAGLGRRGAAPVEGDVFGGGREGEVRGGSC
jgi:hypothetical protein